VGAADRAGDESGLDALHCVEEADVRRHVHHPQARGEQQHRHLLGAGQLGEQFGVPRVAVAGGVQRLLVERRGADRVDAVGERELGGDAHVLEGRFAGHRRDLSPRQVGGHTADVDDLEVDRDPADLGGRVEPCGVTDHQRIDHRPHVLAGEGLDHHLGTDPGRVAHRDRNGGPRGRGCHAPIMHRRAGNRPP